MLDKIIERARKGGSTEERLNWLREELHHLILQEADRKGAFSQICFVGGTALRIVYGLDRFSEDLDFSTSASLAKPFDLAVLLGSIQKSLEAFGFDCRLSHLKAVQAVQSGFFVFGRVLHEVDRSFQKQQNLAIKFGVDTRPPAGGVEGVSPVTGMRLYKVRHYEIGSLLAGKIHAILCRTYPKGRDYYDFLWYMGQTGIAVNATLLQNAYEQTQKKKIKFTNDSLRALLAEKFAQMDYSRLKKDVAPFISDQGALTLFSKEIFVQAAQKLRVL